jgi:nucleoid DNA-binding protein
MIGLPKHPGGTMNELVSLIVKKTGIPEATAQNIVNIVIDFISKKLPAPFGAQVKSLLSNDQAVTEAENILGESQA